jgi:hypothetical protein
MLNLSKIQKLESRSISPENFGGEKGKGGMAEQGTGAEAARDLGRGWKISPSVKLEAGETFTLADIKEKGIIKHIWITDSAPQRCLVIRMYWDDSDIPSVEVPLGDFFACADFEDYRNTQLRISKDFLDRDNWNKMSLMNISGAGRFAADRAINEYAANIWDAKSALKK